MLAQTADPHAYLKWPRLIMFNINGAVSIAATAVSARSFVVLNHDKATLAATIPGAQLHTVNVVAITATMCAVAGLGSLYTAALSTAITLKWHRVETLKTIRVKEAIMATLLIVLLASAIVGTIIIVPKSAGVSGPYPSSVIKTIIESTGKSLAYKKSLAFPTLILVWICFGTTTICFILAALAARHIRKYGPENTTVGHAVSSHHQYGDSNDQVGRVATREEKSEKAHTRHVEHA